MKTIRVANVEHCIDGQWTDPFSLSNYKDYTVEDFIKALNDEEIPIENVFCFLIEPETQTDHTL